MFKIIVGLALILVANLSRADYCNEGQWLEVAKESGYTEDDYKSFKKSHGESGRIDPWDNYQRGSDCKVMPSDPYKVIVVFSKWNGERGFYSLDVMIVNAGTGKILSRLSEVRVVSSVVESAVGVYIDTARYKLAEGDRAFGVKVSHDNNSKVSPGSDTVLNLFVEKGGEINHLLKKFHCFNKCRRKLFGPILRRRKRFFRPFRRRNDFLDKRKRYFDTFFPYCEGYSN